MKSNRVFVAVTLGVIGLFAVGCDQPESQTPATTGQSSTGGVTAVTEQSKAAAGKVATNAQAAVDQAAADVTKQAQAVIAKAKAFLAEKKYQEALTALAELGNAKLPPDLQKIVDDLKAEAQKLMSGDATKAAGGPPEPK